MRQAVTMAMLVTASVGALGIAAACTPDEDADFAAVDTGYGVVDTATSEVATAVAATVTGENILALLDTSMEATVELNGLAASKASSAKVRELARTAAARHQALGRTNEAIARAVSASGKVTDLGPLEDHHDTMERLRMLSGRRFDRAYLEHFVELDEDLLDEVDESLGMKPTDEIREYLLRVQDALQTDLEAARPLLEEAKSVS